MKVKVNYEGPKKKYMLPPEKQSCYEYLQESYARISADIGDYTAFVSVDCETKMSKLFEDVEKLELPEDQEKGMEKDIQDLVNEYNKKIEAKLKEKEQELLTV